MAAHVFSQLLTYLDTRTVLLCMVVFLFMSFIVQGYLERAKNLPPGPVRWPVVGCLPQLIKDTATMSVLEVCASLSRRYGPVCHLPLPFGRRVIIISGYDAVNELLTRNEFNGRTEAGNPHNDELLATQGVIMASGDTWKEHRRFSLTVLRSFGVGKRSFEFQIATESESLLAEIHSFNRQPFDPTQLFCNAVSNVICSVVFGKRFEYGDLEFKRLLHLLEDSMSHIPIGLLLWNFPSLLKIPFFPKGAFPSFYKLRQNLKVIVDEHRDSFDKENMRDFIDAYLNEIQVKTEQEAQTHLNDMALVAMVHDLFLAGTETTSTTLRWALLYMLKFPDVQNRVHEEIDTVVGRDRSPQLSDKPNLPYTEAVIHEIQRFAGIIFFTVPRCSTSDVEYRGHTIPKGSNIFVDFHSVTRDPSVWDHPSVFKPERFLDENGQVVKISENKAFGAGKRVCLGEQLARMELFIFFTNLMHRFSFRKPPGTGNVNIEPNPGGVLTPFPYTICAIPRN